MDEFIERRIITGMIVSTEFLQRIQKVWDIQLVASPITKTMASWCWEYFNTYNQAPGRDIEGIYAQKRNGMPAIRAQNIEELLVELSEEYEHEQFNVDYLTDQTKQYFKQQQLKNFAEGIQDALATGDLVEAERLAVSYLPVISTQPLAIEPLVDEDKIKQAFERASNPLITFPKVLGHFWNHQLVRDAFIAFLGPEKRGKTYWLMEMAMRAKLCGCNVIFFQAGDMSEMQQVRRLCIYLASRSNEERYCKDIYIPALDCVHNQMDTCDRDERECSFGLFDEEIQLSKIKYDDLKLAVEQNPDYKPCRNCDRFKGAVWLQLKKAVEPLDWKTALEYATRYQRRNKRRFKLCTYPNETLSVAEIRSLLDIWERQEQFVADVIVIDYADILAPDPDCRGLDFRNQTNKIWQRLRRLSQERHCLVITATQAAATSYGKDLLKMSDYSEDKRKFAHVTAMWGLNQTDEEKKIGIMRINEMVLREGDFSRIDTIKVLQRLQVGRPYLGSFS